MKQTMLMVAFSAYAGFACAQEPMTAPVRSAIEEARKQCAPDKLTLEKGFAERRDVNGDGIADFILDHGRATCGGTSWCGTAGCTTQVFASLLSGGYVKVLDENVNGLTFKRVKGRPAMILGLHGSACGRAGAEACGATLYWNGSRFSPAH